MATIQFFRESLVLDDTLIGVLNTAGLNPQPGDTLVLGAAICSLQSLDGIYDYVLAADKLSVISGSVGLQDPSGRKCLITVLSGEIDGTLNLVANGIDGGTGAKGPKGEDGGIVNPEDIHGVSHGKPRQLPGEPGGNGADGETGGEGGAVRILYVNAVSTPTASVAGGKGGHGGAGGVGGFGKPNGKPGQLGARGHAGLPGTADIAKADLATIWNTLDVAPGLFQVPILPPPRKAWAAYRTAVGHYYFRRFDPKSQIAAFGELKAALLLDPANADAQTLLLRIIRQQTPTGLSRDIDISPDYKDLSASLPAEAALVQNAFLFVQGNQGIEVTAAAARDQLSLTATELTHRAAEAQDNVHLAQGDVTIAKAETSVLAKQLTDVQSQIDAARNQSFSFGDFITDVATIGGAIAGIASGVGAIVAIPSSIAAVGKLVDSGKGVLEILKNKELKEDLSNLGSGVTALVKGVSGAENDLVNFSKVLDELSAATNQATQNKIGQLLQQQAALVRQKMIADLRSQQAQDRVTAAQRQFQDYATESQAASALASQWSGTEDFLVQSTDRLISSARRLADIVAEDVFLARRALEIYELDDASDVRFDYGYLHPDDDQAPPLDAPDRLTRAVRRIEACLTSANQLAPNVLTWNDVFLRLNTAHSSGFDVVHPAVSVSISDPASLAHLQAGGGLQFTIDASATPASLYELKVDNVTLTLEGASAPSPVLLWMEHSGHWKMIPRTSPGETAARAAEFTLFPHSEALNCNAGQGVLTAAIPARPQTPAEPGPPFAFWGRGVIADWRIYPDPSALGLDLTKLTAIKLTFGCIGFAAQGRAIPQADVFRAIAVQLPALRHSLSIAASG